ncbi:hypothetical protein OHV05_35500 (plasmid) [Kitasatospora sp. NBC_00070]|uniref:hypothetical protein n=1 Tax=Kitasatospora sp. NBC_00070 TaxID=2975962 RepID=UPI002F913CF8
MRARDGTDRAVLYEREKGTSWEVIADQLGVKRQSAHERYREAEQAWKDALHDPYNPQPPGARYRSLRLHEAASHPSRTGSSWTVGGQARVGEQAVTGRLPTLSLLDEMNHVLEGLNYLYRDMRSGGPDPMLRLRLTERQAASLERIAVEEGRPSAAVLAEEARALAAQLRAALDSTA